MVGHWIKTKHGAIAATLKQESNLHLWSVTGVIYSPLLPCTHIAWSPCCWGWHIYSCFRMAGRQSDMSYCLSDASCLSSIPWTRRRELHNWRTNIPTSCSWVVIMMDLLTTWLSISVTLEPVPADLIWTFWLRIPPDNGSLRDPCEVCRTVVGTQFPLLQSTMKWTLRIITCSWKDSWWIADASSG